MKFKVQKEVILAACNKCQKFISSKNTLPILDCIKFDMDADGFTSMFASDLQTHIQTNIKVEYDDESTSFCLASKLLVDTLSKLPSEEIQFTVSDVQCVINTSNGEFTMPVYDSKEFPLMHSIGVTTFECDNVPITELLSVVHSVLFAVSKEELRPAMCGVNIIKKDFIYFNGTDGHRASSSVLDVASEGEINISVPVKPLSSLKDLFDDKVNIAYGDCLSIADGNTHIQVTLIKENYPDIFSVMPKVDDSDITFKAKKFDLMKLLKLATIYGNKTSGLITFTVNNGELVIDAQDLDFSVSATEKYPCKTNGNIRIGFNGNILLDCVKNINCDDIEFRFTAPNRAALILDADRIANQKMLIMPLMIQ